MSLKLKYTVLIIIFIISIPFSLSYATCGSCDSGQVKLELPLKLLGTVIESEPEKSLAVIREISSQKQGVYKALDRILGYQVAKIERGRVKLLKEGKLFILDFPLGSESEPIVTISADKRIINSSALAKRLPGLNAAIKEAKAIPYLESGRFAGFKIMDLKDNHLAKLAGLRKGDIVTTVNGEKLDSLRKPLEILPNLRNQDKVTVEIKRGSEIKNLVYYLQ